MTCIIAIDIQGPLSLSEPEEVFDIVFSPERRALATRAQRVSDLGSAVTRLGLGGPRPVLVLIGGASELRDADIRLVGDVVSALVEVAAATDAAIVDGGTDAGVMRLAGQARSVSRGPSPYLVGVAVEDLVTWPGGPVGGNRFPLEAHHTHFVLTPGQEWGDESDALATVARLIAGERPSVTVLLNGGEASLNDTWQTVKAGRSVIVAEASGRAADTLAAASRDRIAAEGLTADLVNSGLLEVVDITNGPENIARVVERNLRA